MKILTFTATFLLLLCAVQCRVSATDGVIYVCDSGDNASDGTSADTALKTLAAAYKKIRSKV